METTPERLALLEELLLHAREMRVANSAIYNVVSPIPSLRSFTAEENAAFSRHSRSLKEAEAAFEDCLDKLGRL